MGSRLTCRLFFSIWIFSFLTSTLIYSGATDIKQASESEEKYQEPTVMVAILVRNKASILPWFFGHLEQLNYPKERITIWIRSDHNEDNTASMLRNWVKAIEDQYHMVDLEIDEDSRGYEDSKGPMDWSEERFDKVIKLREEALQTARKLWADYLFMLDADVILENPETINLLIDAKQPVVAPMLNASIGEVYSNFWGGMTDEGYYQRVSGYFDVLERKPPLGVFEVPMVHSAVMMDMHLVISKNFSYLPKSDDYKGPRDDIIIFAHNIKAAGLVMHIVNMEYFGVVMLPMESHNSVQDEADHFDYVRLEAEDANEIDEVKIGRLFPVDRPGLIQSPHIEVLDKKLSKLGYDQIYMINLLRRPDRRKRMVKALKVLGIEAKIVDAVDGKQLNDTYLKTVGVKMMKGYADRYHNRSLTMGEIGCFLSHFFIWKEIVEHKYEKVIVFEDDVRFEPYFIKKLNYATLQVEKLVKDWDLMYLGRKRLQLSEEKLVDGSDYLVWPSYSYWTLAYTMSLQGATKLLDQKPLSKMIPVDEYLPIMFDKHPEESWKNNFSPRNLVGLSSQPLLVYPTHYTGEPNYISDTEDSTVIPKEEGDEPNVDVNLPDQDIIQNLQKSSQEKEEL